MQKDKREKALWLLIGTLLLAVAALLLDGRSILPPNRAQAFENPIDQRGEAAAETRKVNERLDRLIALFESGKVKVIVANAEEFKAAPPVVIEGGAKPDAESKIVIKRKAE